MLGILALYTGNNLVARVDQLEPLDVVAVPSLHLNRSDMILGLAVGADHNLLVRLATAQQR
jgi:hypothetical protein